ncbi:MAG: zinc-finger domain-containing protein [Nitratireductor sp.]
MAEHSVKHFQNDIGVSEIKIGVSKFMCCGASAPHDHPHVFLDMGADTQIVCPYCSTLYTFSADLSADQTEPAGCLLEAAS